YEMPERAPSSPNAKGACDTRWLGPLKALHLPWGTRSAGQSSPTVPDAAQAGPWPPGVPGGHRRRTSELSAQKGWNASDRSSGRRRPGRATLPPRRILVLQRGLQLLLGRSARGGFTVSLIAT